MVINSQNKPVSFFFVRLGQKVPKSTDVPWLITKQSVLVLQKETKFLLGHPYGTINRTIQKGPGRVLAE
jgi:hypothetical protein